MIRVSKTQWVNTDKITDVHVDKNNLWINTGSYETELVVDTDYLPDVCRALSLPFPEILGLLERQKTDANTQSQSK
jgi:DNA-binding LytR/AlgR family response regulator